VTSLAGATEAEPLRLRADAIAEAQAPAGLIVLQGEDKIHPWLEAEGLVWAGNRSASETSQGFTGDVLTLSLHAREPHGYGDLRVGRFVVSTGAIRPVQFDGVSVLGRAPFGSTVEAFGGAPVVPRFGSLAYDWIAGGRVAQRILSVASIGASYVQRRAHGEIADDEVGADLAVAPRPWLDVAARSAYDLTNPGVADALASVALRSSAFRVEVFGTHRSPSRLLPATSLFSVLGDFPSDSVGSTVKWLAAPRLDVLVTGAGQSVGGEYGGNATIRALLRLDDQGQGTIGLEGRRQDVSTARWTGARVVTGQLLSHGFRVSTELELVFPDRPRGRGIAWPWGLLALGWRRSGWEVAGAVEAASTSENLFECNALVRLSRTLELL
jgi:hypothetical protein